MNIGNTIRNLVQYLTEGFARVFSPNPDKSPEVGVQPYKGETYKPTKSEKQAKGGACQVSAFWVLK